MKAKVLLTLSTAVLLMNGALSPVDSPRLTFLGGATAQAGVRVDIGFFYNELAPYGQWRQISPYGWVWYPGVAADWQPYTLGNWVFTDDFGWTWISNEPWGWIPFHYGRWFFDDDYGSWAWVPGTVWGPAWVSWRTGDGFIGWAPLPPAVEFAPSVGFSSPDLEFGIRQHSWCFVPEPLFLRPRIEQVIVPRPRNVTIINNTVNVTNYTVINERIVNHSIDVNRLERKARTRVVRYQVAEVDRPVLGETQVRGRQVTLFRPQVVKEAAGITPPQSDSAPHTAGALQNQPRNFFPGTPPQGPKPSPQGQDHKGFVERDKNEQPALGNNRQFEAAEELNKRHQQTAVEQTRRQAEMEQARQQAILQQQQLGQERSRQQQAVETQALEKQRQQQTLVEQTRRQAEMEQARQQAILQQQQLGQERSRQQQAVETQALEKQRQQQTLVEQTRRQAEMEQARQQAILQQQQLGQERSRQQQAVETQALEKQRQQQTLVEQTRRQAEMEQARQQAILQQQQLGQERSRQQQAVETQALEKQRQQQTLVEQTRRQAEMEQARQQAILQQQQLGQERSRQQQAVETQALEKQRQQQHPQERRMPECKQQQPGQQQLGQQQGCR